MTASTFCAYFVLATLAGAVIHMIVRGARPRSLVTLSMEVALTGRVVCVETGVDDGSGVAQFVTVDFGGHGRCRLPGHLVRFV